MKLLITGEPSRYPNVYGTYTMRTISDTDCVSEKPLLDDFGHSFLVQVQLIILFKNFLLI